MEAGIELLLVECAGCSGPVRDVPGGRSDAEQLVNAGLYSTSPAAGGAPPRQRGHDIEALDRAAGGRDALHDEHGGALGRRPRRTKSRRRITTSRRRRRRRRRLWIATTPQADSSESTEEPVQAAIHGRNLFDRAKARASSPARRGCHLPIGRRCDGRIRWRSSREFERRERSTSTDKPPSVMPSSVDGRPPSPVMMPTKNFSVCKQHRHEHETRWRRIVPRVSACERAPSTRPKKRKSVRQPAVRKAQLSFPISEDASARFIPCVEATQSARDMMAADDRKLGDPDRSPPSMRRMSTANTWLVPSI